MQLSLRIYNWKRPQIKMRSYLTVFIVIFNVPNTVPFTILINEFQKNSLKILQAYSKNFMILKHKHNKVLDHFG